jgi:hypothetical protein
MEPCCCGLTVSLANTRQTRISGERHTRWLLHKREGARSLQREDAVHWAASELAKRTASHQVQSRPKTAGIPLEAPATVSQEDHGMRQRLGLSVMALETRRGAISAVATEGDCLGYDGFFMPETWAYDRPCSSAS